MTDQRVRQESTLAGRAWPIPLIGIVMVLVALLAVGCGGGAKQGLVVDFGQSLPAGGGMVQSFVVVQLDDGEEIDVWLPQDQTVWDAMMGAARTGSTTIEFKKDGEFWMYVDVVAP